MKTGANKLIIWMAFTWTLTQSVGHSATLGTTGAVEHRASVSAVAAQSTVTPLHRFRFFNLRGDYLAAGVGMRNRGFGTISISVIPPGSTIKAAYLYWDILANSQDLTFRLCSLNGQLIFGSFVGAGEDPCWGNLFNFAFRADVTSLVSGNGAYSLSGFASGITDGRDPWLSGSVAPMVEGASLVIVYENPAKPQTQILIYDGSIETRSDVVTLSIDGFTAPSPVTRARTTFIGADGQADYTEPGSTFNGNFLPSVRWDGNDPQAGPAFSNGNLWDTMTVDVSALVRPGAISATATVQGGGDCLVWVAQVFSVATPGESKLDVLDPNNLDTTSPKLLRSDGRITIDVEKLAGAKEAWPLTGVVADGVTELLLRIEVNDATTQVTFSLPDGLEDGSLKAVGSAGPFVASLPVSVQSAGGKRWAFAVYISPTNFSAAATTQPDREIKLLVQAGATAATPKVLKLKRPPVVLVHGVWSRDGAWKGLEDYLVNNDYLARHLDLVESKFAREVIRRVNYGGETQCPNANAAGSFDPFASEEDDQKVVKALIDETENVIKELRKRGIAGTQVDVVGHSMGGLVARSRVKYVGTPSLQIPYKRTDNFQRGDFHKLITVGTPHKGTRFADHVVRYRSESLLKTTPAGNGTVVYCSTQTLEDFLAASHKAVGPAIYGFQTASTALENIGATPVPSHAIVGVAPNNTLVEGWLNGRLSSFCNVAARTNVDSLLGDDGNHDTIVPTTSQRGGLSGQAVTEIPSVVHAGDIPFLPDTRSETSSSHVWREVTRLLRAPLDNQTFHNAGFEALVTHATSYDWPGCPSPAQRPAVATQTDLVQQNTTPEPVVTLTPVPGTIVRPGETIQIAFSVTPAGLLTNGAYFFIGEELFFTEGSSPFALSYTVPTNRAGRLTIFADAIYHWANTYVLVQPADPPLSLSVSPDTVEVAYLGVPRALRVLGQYADGLKLDLTSADAGTTYVTLSGGNAVVSVSPNGVLEARGDGQDTILVRNSEKSAFVLVTVRIMNHAPVFDPLNDLNLRPGGSRELNVAVNDADGNAIALSAAVLPPFAKFADLGDGSGRLRLNPGFTDVGAHRITLVAVDDGDPNLGSSRTILITVAAFPKAVYNGLFYDTNGVSHESSGFFTAKTTSKGTFSAKFQLAGKSYSSSGQFNSEGKATNSVTRTGLSPLTLELQLDFTGEEITGRITDGNWSADLTADKALFNVVTNPAPQAGRYTMHIPRNPDSSASPGGDGFGTVTVNAAGKVSLNGTLGDGTKISQKTSLSKNGQWPFYVSSYRGSGSVLSWITFTNDTPKVFGGDMSWIKKANALAKFYAAGFSNETTVVGSLYTPPLPGNRVLNFTDAIVLLIGGNLSQSFSNNVTLGTDNKVVNQSANSLSLTLTPATGLFKGKVIDPATGKSVSFKGAASQKENAGFGYFPGTNQSGSILLQGN